MLLNNVIKIISKKGNGYFISTVFTNIQVLDSKTIISHNIERSSYLTLGENKPIRTLMQHHNEKYVNILQSKEAFECLLTLESINKISINATCQSCGSIVSVGKSCSYAGCHTPVSQRAIDINCSAIFQMEDETFGATIFVKDLSICRKFLYFLEDIEWDLLLKTAEYKGEILFLNKKNGSQNISSTEPEIDIHTGSEKCFIMLCQVYPISNVLQYHCKLRAIKDKESISANCNDDLSSFICLDVKPNI